MFCDIHGRLVDSPEDLPVTLSRLPPLEAALGDPNFREYDRSVSLLMREHQRITNLFGLPWSTEAVAYCASCFRAFSSEENLSRGHGGAASAIALHGPGPEPLELMRLLLDDPTMSMADKERQISVVLNLDPFLWARRAALQLILIRTRCHASPLHLFPKDVVILIARLVFATRRDAGLWHLHRTPRMVIPVLYRRYLSGEEAIWCICNGYAEVFLPRRAHDGTACVLSVNMIHHAKLKDVAAKCNVPFFELDPPVTREALVECLRDIFLRDWQIRRWQKASEPSKCRIT